MTAMGLFAYGLDRDRGELAQGAVDSRLLRRVSLLLKVFLHRFVGNRSLPARESEAKAGSPR